MARKEITSLSESNKLAAWFFIGFSGMATAKFVGASQILVTLVPVSIMAYYFFQLLASHQDSARPERAGDNIYYLGFLFTLSSLGFALYEFGSDSDNKGGQIGDFAIALITTIVGVLGRVWLNQGEKELDEYEKEARFNLADAIDGLRGDMERSRDSLSEFSSMTLQILEENRDEQKRQLESDREAFEKHFIQTLEEMGASLREAVTSGSKELRDLLLELAKSTASQVEVFDASVADMSKHSAELSLVLKSKLEEFRSLPAAQDIINEQVEKFLLPIANSANEVSRIVKQQEEMISEVSSSISLFSRTVSEMQSSMGSLSEQTSQSVSLMVDSGSKQAKAISDVSTGVQHLTSSLQMLDEASLKLESVPNSAISSIAHLESSILGIRDAADTMKNHVDLIGNSSSSLVESLASTANSEKAFLQDLVRDRDELTKSVAASNEQIANQIKSLESQLSVMSEALISAAKYIRSETSIT